MILIRCKKVDSKQRETCTVKDFVGKKLSALLRGITSRTKKINLNRLKEFLKIKIFVI